MGDKEKRSKERKIAEKQGENVKREKKRKQARKAAYRGKKAYTGVKQR